MKGNIWFPPLLNRFKEGGVSVVTMVSSPLSMTFCQWGWILSQHVPSTVVVAILQVLSNTSGFYDVKFLSFTVPSS